MAEFLTRKDVAARLEKIIRNAEKELILISPYVKIDKHTRGDLEYLLARKYGIKINLIYRNKNKTDLDPEDRDWLESKPSIKLSFQKDLHAKCYLNESQAVLTSMNLYDFSQENNIEMGISVSHDEDHRLYHEIREEAVSIIHKSDEERRPGLAEKLAKVVQEFVEPYDPGQPPETSKDAFCIRCKRKVELIERPEKVLPYCKDCWDDWKDERQKKTHEEKYCHKCGEEQEHPTTMLKPLCLACYGKYKNLFEFRS